MASAQVSASLSLSIRATSSMCSPRAHKISRLPVSSFSRSGSIFAAGPLTNFGLTTPLPTVALAVIALVAVLTANFIFQSASKS